MFTDAVRTRERLDWNADLVIHRGAAWRPRQWVLDDDDGAAPTGAVTVTAKVRRSPGSMPSMRIGERMILR